MSLIYGNSRVIINDFIGHVGHIVVLRHLLSFIATFPGDNCISSLVCSLLDCVHSSAIFGVVYCNMALPCILDLFQPLVVCTILHHTRL